MTTSSICVRYFLYILLSYAVMFGVSVLLSLVGIDLNAGAGTIVGALIPAWFIARYWVSQRGGAPDSGTAWRFSFYFTIIQIAFTAFMLVPLSFVVPELNQMANGLGIAIMSFALVFIGLMYFLATRWFFSMFAKQFAKVGV